MKPVDLPSADRLREMFSYDPETGVLRWKIKPAKCILIGDEVGHLSSIGYVQVQIAGQRCLAHRIIWKLVTGEEPIGIDHCNGDPSDNRLVNLRLATQSQNRTNSRRPKSARPGLKGTSFKAGKWEASVHTKDKYVYLGRFKTEQEAHQAYCEVADQLFGEFRRTI